MKFGTFAATTVVAVAALGISAGTAHSKPPTVTEELRAQGVEQGIDYTTTSDPSGRTITTKVEDGTFEVVEGEADKADRAVLKSEDGAVVAEIPLAYEISGAKVSVAHEIADDGRELTLTTKPSAKEIGEMRPISSMSRLVAELEKNVVGVVAGAVIGGLIGAVIGMGFFTLLTGPIGAVVGALAGGAIMGGQPFVDAIMAVLNGQP
ncbi:hypothetical protein [Nocardia cyriacigeorgica]|uniref:DUF8020 domain-containing protein n=1 Tax=Nocardia cyriacigeorgica TaxID=135487 RepID=A0A5R8PFA5_9NOCA|nr:hypothetical protein [Nocardia cyriacigeorgica]TLF74866.1 hypothetical protein FEK34_23015 [Nocardia cyriacigeorgica]TLG12197.1 hypothetical protein FEK35_11875 [Nocardia cyriacigeorgica]